jgi:hypothetical protein
MIDSSILSVRIYSLSSEGTLQSDYCTLAIVLATDTQIDVQYVMEREQEVAIFSKPADDTDGVVLNGYFLFYIKNVFYVQVLSNTSS